MDHFLSSIKKSYIFSLKQLSLKLEQLQFATISNSQRNSAIFPLQVQKAKHIDRHEELRSFCFVKKIKCRLLSKLHTNPSFSYNIRFKKFFFLQMFGSLRRENASLPPTRQFQGMTSLGLLFLLKFKSVCGREA